MTQYTRYHDIMSLSPESGCIDEKFSSQAQGDDAKTKPRPSNSNYLRLAALIGKHPTVAIFRRFRHLGAQVLLFKQAEILHLEAEMKTMPIPLTNDQEPNWAQNWETFVESDEYAVYFDDLTRKLKDYYETLAAFQKADSFADPENVDASALRAWLHHPHGGNNFLKGCEQHAYDKDFAHDLATTSERRQNRDLFSALISDSATTLLHSTFPKHFNPKSYDSPTDSADPRLEANLTEWNDKKLRRYTGLFVVLISYAIPAGALFALYFIPMNQMVARLGAVVGFSAVFSVCLKLFTRARPIEVFAAVAAYVFLFGIIAVLLSDWRVLQHMVSVADGVS